MLFFLAVNIAIPLVYYLLINEVHLYSDLFDWSTITLVTVINALSLGISMLLIKLMPLSRRRVAATIDGHYLRYVFYVSMFFKLVYGFVSGGVQGVLAGAMNGTILNWINIFINPTLIIACIFLLERSRKKAYIIFIIYAIEETLSGSRGALIMLPLLLIYGRAFEGFDSKRNQVWLMLVFSIFFAPVIFIFATGLRSEISNMNMFDMVDLIVGRLSSLELSAIPVYYLGNSNIDWGLFFEKYSALSQIKGVVNSLSPFKPFPLDIMPNQYFYAIFFEKSIDYVKINYSSIPITLSVFIYLYVGILGVVVTSVVIAVYYVFIIYLIRYPVLCVIFVLQLYPLLIYFDWVWLFKVTYSYLLTSLFLIGFLAMIKMFANFNSSRIELN